MLKVVRRLENKLEKLNERLHIIYTALNFIGGSSYTDRFAQLMAMKAELEAEKAEIIKIQAHCKAELSAILVENIESTEIRDVMYLRYGGLRSFEEVASMLDLSIRKVYRLHEKGLKSITKKL